jgi:hypothetical protein
LRATSAATLTWTARRCAALASASASAARRSPRMAPNRSSSQRASKLTPKALPVNGRPVAVSRARARGAGGQADIGR